MVAVLNSLHSYRATRVYRKRVRDLFDFKKGRFPPLNENQHSKLMRSYCYQLFKYYIIIIVKPA